MLFEEEKARTLRPQDIFSGKYSKLKKTGKITFINSIIRVKMYRIYHSHLLCIFFTHCLIFSWHFYLDHVDAKTFISFHKRHSCFGLLRYGVVKFSFHNIWGVLQWKLYETCVAKHRIIYTILQLCPSVGQICHDNVILF